MELQIEPRMEPSVSSSLDERLDAQAVISTDLPLALGEPKRKSRLMTRVRAILAAITYARVMAVIFTMFIFYVGAVTFPTTVVNIGNMLKDTTRDFVKARDGINKSYNEMLVFKNNIFVHKGSYINVNGLMAKAMGQRLMNTIVKLDNGQLFTTVGRWNDDGFNKAVNSITQLYEAQRDKGKHYLFVIAPDKLDPDGTIHLPVGFADYNNENWDRLAKTLDEKGIPYLDLRQSAKEDGLDWGNIHYVTDHHWREESGFWAYGKIMQRLAEMGAIPAVDPMYYGIDNFQVDTYEKWFLGSSGKRVGTAFGGVDDFKLIYPKFETEMSIEITSGKISKTGSFLDVALNPTAYRTKDYFNLNPYGAYGWGDRDYTQYRNAGAPLDLKFLSFGDSFGNTTSTYFPLCAKTCDELDMRHYKGDFAKYYNEYDPDVVVAICYRASDNLTYNFFSQ